MKVWEEKSFDALMVFDTIFDHDTTMESVTLSADYGRHVELYLHFPLMQPHEGLKLFSVLWF